MSILDFKLKYKGTKLGFVWTFFEPLAQLTILYFVFSYLISSQESNFILYLFIGLITIHVFSRSTSRSLNCFPSRANILTSINPPKIIFPISIIVTNVLIFAIELGIFTIFALVIGMKPTLIISLFPFFITLLIIFTTGISIILSVIRAYFKDIQTIWNIVTMSLIFITPVFWAVKDMPKQVSDIFLLNPLALLMELFHKVLLFNEYPTTYEYIYATCTSLGTILIAYVIYKKYEKQIMEKL